MIRFPLWQFIDSQGQHVVTRGRTVEEAAKFFRVICGKVVKPLDYCYSHAARAYSVDHPFDWTNSPPRWLDPTAPFLPEDATFGERFCGVIA